MPGGDRTGPMGAGPMSGRGAGFCAGNGTPGYSNRGFGRGMGRGQMGMGGRFRNGWQGMPVTQPNPAQERQMLEQEASYLKQHMEQIQARLDQLGESS